MRSGPRRAHGDTRASAQRTPQVAGTCDARFGDMSPQRRYRIVIALDGSEYSPIVLEHALDQAARQAECDLHLVTVVNNRFDVDTTQQWLAQTALEGLDAFEHHASGWRTRLHVRVGKPDEEIPILASEVDADLLVIGNYGLHGRDPIASRIVERMPCATLVIGLAGHEVETVEQCPDCVAIRESSEGERWFCEAHRSDVELRMSTLLPLSTPLGRGGTMW